MPAVLHLIKSTDAGLARAAIERQRAAGNAVTVVVLHGAPAPEVPAGVRVLRVPDDLPWDRLLDLIFEADRVITW